jgi:Nif-specific regulatory protein
MSDRIRLLGEIADRIASATELDDVLGPVLRTLDRHADLERGALTVLDRRAGVLRLVAAHGLTPSELRRVRYRIGEGITGAVAADGEARVVRDPSRSEVFVDKLGAVQGGLEGVFTAVPVRVGDTVLGTLSGWRTTGDDAHDLPMLKAVAAMLGPLVDRAVQAPSEATPKADRPANLIGRSKPMQEVYALVAQVAASPTTVLLRGESGTGKELVAQAVHEGSPRMGGPFVKVNCAALPTGIIESELFGHERGAFTGATTRRRGRFELASTGTLFLDEIGDLAPETQVKLLRVLQEQQIERVGSDMPVPVDVRVIAATSRDLEAMIADGSFRSDLYYRLNVFPIHLPPLRNRRTDVLLLADHFVQGFATRRGRRIRRIATPAIDLLMSYHWPGNVRELENCLERAALLAEDDVIMAHHLPPTLQAPDRAAERPLRLDEALGALERDLIVDALKATRGNMAAAARQLGVTERVMGLRIKTHGIDPKRFKSA